ncbi:MAG: hypothetical protein IJC21_03675, partial [Lentisphaeria bacterium]|nr:hypothetical protein [Lentisphaeria bacterium]
AHGDAHGHARGHGHGHGNGCDRRGCARGCDDARGARHNNRASILWFDGHADLNSPQDAIVKMPGLQNLPSVTFSYAMFNNSLEMEGSF